MSPGHEARMLNELVFDGDTKQMGTAEDLFAQSPEYFPGILLLYNVETGHLYRIQTD